MARFSRAGDHAGRRSTVVAAIDRIDLGEVGRVAAARTHLRLDEQGGDTVDAIDMIARVVPTEALAVCLGARQPLDRTVADVESMVRVIGRGERPSPASDAAVGRLTADLAHHQPVVAALSILYQSFDATAALIGTALLARAAGAPRVAAVPRTRRVALGGTEINGRVVRAGTAVTLEIGSAGLEFGAGPHECPGRDLAIHLADSIITAIEASGYRVDTTRVALDADGRPTSLTLVRA